MFYGRDGNSEQSPKRTNWVVNMISAQARPQILSPKSGEDMKSELIAQQKKKLSNNHKVIRSFQEN